MDQIGMTSQPADSAISQYSVLPVPAIDGEDNLKTMAAVDACYLSAREGRAVTLAEVMKVEPTSGQGSPTSRRSSP